MDRNLGPKTFGPAHSPGNLPVKPPEREGPEGLRYLASPVHSESKKERILFAKDMDIPGT
jgi:hypothetical protein